MAFGIERRKFITAFGGAAIAWPLTARTQERERMPRIGVLMNLAADDAEGQARLAAFLQGLQEVGWVVGRNVSIDLRWGAADGELFRRYAMELVALAPDVFLAGGGSTALPLHKATRTIPIVFANAGRPGRRRARGEPGAAGRKRYRIYDIRIQHGREMVGIAQAGRTKRNTSVDTSGFQ